MSDERPRVTDEMTTNAHGVDAAYMVGRRIIDCYPVVDSDRAEHLWLLDNGTVVLVSCDPIRHDERGVPILDPARWPGWEVCMYDATDTDAGRAIRAVHDQGGEHDGR